MKRVIVCIPKVISPGARVILNEYYNNAVNDKDNEYVFILSDIDLETRENIMVKKYSHVSRGWGQRWIFENMHLPSIVNSIKADEILCLSNLIVPRIDIKQTLYMQQALPFSGLTRKDFISFRDYLISQIKKVMIVKSMKHSNNVIVQTKWLKDVCVNKYGIESGKMVVHPPQFNIEIKKKFKKINMCKVTFFYPAESYFYKNHRIVIEAMDKIERKYFDKFEVLFTVSGKENNNIIQIRENAEKNKYPIRFAGRMTRDEVFKMYAESIMIFPSYVESFGVPLLEAKMHDTPIIASNCYFSHEILDGYPLVTFFDHANSKELARIIMEFCDKYLR